jgi:hypothetical protein
MSDQSTLYRIRDQMMALDPTERDTLKALLEREEQRTPTMPSHDEAALFAAITACTPPGVTRFRTLNDLVRDKRHGVTRAAFADATRAVFDIIGQTRRVRHPAQDHAALLELMFECLVKDMKMRRVEVAQKSLIENIHRLRTAVESCFPGYLDAGMLHRLIRIAVPA